MDHWFTRGSAAQPEPATSFAAIVEVLAKAIPLPMTTTTLDLRQKFGREKLISKRKGPFTT